MFYFMPTNEIINNDIETLKEEEISVFLLDNDNYVSNVIAYYDSNSIEDLIKKKLEILKTGLDDFKPTIPKETKINKIKVDKNNAHIDFSEELLNIDEDKEEKMIESIVYSLTEINGIDNIYLSINKKSLLELPNSHKELNYPLTRNYGINKEYDLNSLLNINKTTVYFIKNYDNNKYYVPVTKINNDYDDQIEIIIKELKSSINAQNNLISPLSDRLKLIKYEFKDNNVLLTFNEEVDDDSKDLINKSLKENYNVDEIKYITKK